MTQQKPLPPVPRIQEGALYDYLRQLHDRVESLSSSSAAPNQPTNFSVTPVAGGNVVQFTRSNGVSYTLYMADSPNRAAAGQVSLGTANSFTDTVGAGDHKRYYWVEALSQTGTSSGVVGPRSGVTLALGTATTVPSVQPSFARVFDTTINRTRPVIATVDDVAGQPNQPS